MATHYQVYEAWIQYALGKRKRDGLKGTNVSYRGDSIYSYHHWEMGRILRDKKGKPRLLWLNGDVYSSSTSTQQSNLRSVCNEQEGLPVVILPKSSLDSAGIILESIKPIDVKPDGWETIKHHSKEFPEGAERVKVWSKPVIEYVFYEDDPGDFPVPANKYWDGRWHRCRKTESQSCEEMIGFVLRNYTRGVMDLYKPVIGEWFTTNPIRSVECFNPITETSEGYTWTTRRHRLGDCVFRAKVRSNKKVSGTCCVPCKGKGFVDRWQRRARCLTCHGMGGLVKRYERWATFISSFDPQEAGRFYFLCELPYGAKPETLEDALECLKPEAVKMAEMLNKRVVRQGDIFFIETSLSDDDVKDNAKRIGKTRELKLLGQNHSATRVAYMKDGLQLSKGRVYHLPGEHRVQELGERFSWWAVVKNTCPIRKG